MMRPPSGKCLSAAPGGNEQAAHVEVHDLVHLLKRGFLERLWNCGAGVVHQNVELSVGRNHFVHRRLDGPGVGGISLDRDSLSPAGLNLIDDMCGIVRTSGVGDCDAGTVCGKTFGDGGTNSP